MKTKKQRVEKEVTVKGASVEWSGYPEANARLIAAAPELLAASELALHALKETMANEPANVVWSPARDAFKALEAAIAKAEGRA